jgi:hypothetical protein
MTLPFYTAEVRTQHRYCMLGKQRDYHKHKTPVHNERAVFVESLWRPLHVIISNNFTLHEVLSMHFPRITLIFLKFLPSARHSQCTPRFTALGSCTAVSHESAPIGTELLTLIMRTYKWTTSFLKRRTCNRMARSWCPRHFVSILTQSEGQTFLIRSR